MKVIQAQITLREIEQRYTEHKDIQYMNIKRTKLIHTQRY